MSPGLAKNHIRRALRAIVDPEPKEREITELWEHFGSACAYCGYSLDRRMRNGHVDHLVHNGSNHISNRVLSCPTCNGDEKREGPWLEFLRKKNPDQSIYYTRKDKIESWCSKERMSSPRDFDKQRLENEIGAVVSAFDLAVVRLRHEKDNKSEDI